MLLWQVNDTEGNVFLLARAQIIDELETTIPKSWRSSAWSPAFIHFIQVSLCSWSPGLCPWSASLSSASVCSVPCCRCAGTVRALLEHVLRALSAQKAQGSEAAPALAGQGEHYQQLYFVFEHLVRRSSAQQQRRTGCSPVMSLPGCFVAGGSTQECT